MTNKQVAERWIIGKADCHTVNMLYENNTIYSMNYQFPIATIKSKIVYFNNTKHSRTADCGD